ncbi:MAG: hypothetical protein JOY78_20365 [Pseudonocardia sp.]|nr:hypothetical protein [Pseudonocardia sp.]
MSERIDAEQLQEGDVFLCRALDASRHPILRKAVTTRTVRTVETYTVIDYRVVGTGAGGTLNLLHGINVERLGPITLEEIDDVIALLNNGEHATIWRIGEELFT